MTGVSGFSGSFVARHLARAGFDVVGIYRRETVFLKEIVDEPRLKLAREDLINVQTINGRFEVVVHAAATSPAVGVTTAQMVRDNVNSTLALIEAAVKWRCTAFILFSSVSVFGEVASPILDETCPIVEPDAYGETKHISELLLAERDDHLPGLALRLPGVIGPGAHRNWLSSVAESLKAGQGVKAFNLDAAFNNAAHIGDIADMIGELIQRRWQGFDSVVLGASGVITVRSAINKLAEGMNVVANIEPKEALKKSFVLSSERAINCWNYRPMMIESMMQRYGEEVRRRASQGQ